MSDEKYNAIKALVEKHGGEVIGRLQDSVSITFPTQAQQEAYVREYISLELWKEPNDPTT